MESNLESSYSTLASVGVSSLVGLDVFSEILAQLPDEFYDLDQEKKDSYWRRVYAELVRTQAARGEQDVTRLAQLYKPIYNRINQEIKP